MKGEYYLLRLTSDPKIIGVNNGITQVELDENNPITEKLENFFLSSRYWEEQKYIPDFEIKNCTATLLKNAKLTDFLQFDPGLMTCPFMISGRLLEVFTKFKIQTYRTYPVTLFDKRKQINDRYNIFCCPFLGYEVIDFPKSVFYKGSNLIGKKYLQFGSEKEYRSDLSIKKVEKLVLNSNFDSSLDFFQTRIGEMYISEGLKDAIEILGFTGVNIFDDKEPEIIIES